MSKDVVKTLCDLVEDLCDGRETYLHDYVDAALKAANYIEELEGKLAKAVEDLEQIATHRKKCHEYDDDVGHERRTFDVEDVIIMEYAAQSTLAELKGQDDGR